MSPKFYPLTISHKLYLNCINKIDILCLWYYSLLEEGDTILTFEGDKKKCSTKIVLKVHNPHFYWKVLSIYVGIILYGSLAT